MKQRRIILAGGSGFLGQALAAHLERHAYEPVILTRAPGWNKGSVRQVPWDGRTLGAWAETLEDAWAVINLAGRSVNCRYTSENRRAIRESRVDSTRIIGEAIAQAVHPPPLWLQASTATIYAHRYDAPNDEATGLIGGNEPGIPDTWRFSVEVAKAWERTMDEAQTPRTRKVALRSAMVMGSERGGVFDTLLSLVRHGLGGQAGDGRQYVSWIREQDFLRAICWLLDGDTVRDGPVNLAAPTPLPNAAFMRALREAWGRSFGLPATEWILELGALFLQTETELILKSRRVTPGRLLDAGFSFDFPTWPEAAHGLCRRWREE